MLVGTAAALLRAFRVGPTFDLFYDEVLYQEMGAHGRQRGIPAGRWASVLPASAGVFYLEAGWVRLLGSSPDVVRAVYQARLLNSALAGVSPLLLVLLVSRVASRRAGLLAGALFAADPYLGRINGKVLLETSAMTWVLVAYTIVLPLASGRQRWVGRRAVIAGAAFGLAILTKDLTALVTLVPLGVAVLWLSNPSGRARHPGGGRAVRGLPDGRGGQRAGR